MQLARPSVSLVSTLYTAVGPEMVQVLTRIALCALPSIDTVPPLSSIPVDLE